MTCINSTNLTQCNSTNKFTLDYPIGFLSAITFSLLFDIITLTTIFKTRFKLIETEFLILLVNNILSLVFKLIGLLKTVDQFASTKFLGIINCYIVYSLNNDVFFGIFVTYLYYGLFHLSTVSQICYLNKLFAMTHSNHGFFIFFGIAFGGYTVFIFTYTTIFRVAIFGENNQACNGPNEDLYNILAITSILISFPTQFVYLAAILLLIGLRISAPKDSVFAKKFKKKFIILFKFFMFSVLIFLISAPQYIIPIISAFWGHHPSKLVRMSSDSIFLIFFSIQCICLLLIHNFLRRTFTKTFIWPLKHALDSTRNLQLQQTETQTKTKSRSNQSKL